MTHEQFNKFQAELLAEVTAMKDTKGKEYANSEDKFANFKRLAARLGVSPLQIATVYVTKHLDSIDSYVKNNKTFSTESIRGRFVDVITYFTLMAGMVAEQDSPKDAKSNDYHNVYGLAPTTNHTEVAPNMDHIKCTGCDVEFHPHSIVYYDKDNQLWHRGCAQLNKVMTLPKGN